VPKDEPEKESTKSGGWGIFSLFSRKSHVEEKKPIKANLGDENQFYFDEKEKRWVWKSVSFAKRCPKTMTNIHFF
jgi:hypothetical protein